MWEPASILSSENPSFTYSLLVLNQPIHASLYIKLCDTAVDVVCADGGANRVYDMDSEYSLENVRLLNFGMVEPTLCLAYMEQRHPDFICGDMDSVRPEVEKAFANLGVKIIRDKDLYSTDFIKSLRVIHNKVKLDHPRSRHRDSHHQVDKRQRIGVASEDEKLNVIVLGGLGGRADQAFSQLHHLYAASIEPSLDRIGRIYLVTEESIIFLLEQGSNRIATPVKPGQLGKDIGIIPLGRPSIITTHGLEWDVTDWETSFGTQISTSNYIRDSYVDVFTTERVLFTVHIAR